MALDETITEGQSGHRTDHETLHILINDDLVVHVNHGATAGTARPTVAGTAAVAALWDGSVVPTNAVDGDWWWNTDVLAWARRTSGTFESSQSTVFYGSTAGTARPRTAGPPIVWVGYIGTTPTNALPTDVVIQDTAP